MQRNGRCDVNPGSAKLDLRCHVCGGAHLRRKFSVPVSGGPYQNLSRRAIYQCESCGHCLADIHGPSVFAGYYESLSADCHFAIHDSDQFRYHQVLKIISRHTVKRVLDIGCGTGTFLAMLPPDVERFGIEPTKAAADIARARGIQIIEYGDLARPELQSTFDVVTAIDMLEHAADLEKIRQNLAKALRSGGIAILLTGDAESWSARLPGRFWYYMIYEEHITFFSSRSIRTWLQPDFDDVVMTRTSHSTPMRAWYSVIRSWLVFPVKLVLRKVLPVRYTALFLPNDHILVRAVRK